MESWVQLGFSLFFFFLIIFLFKNTNFRMFWLWRKALEPRLATNCQTQAATHSFIYLLSTGIIETQDLNSLRILSLCRALSGAGSGSERSPGRGVTKQTKLLPPPAPHRSWPGCPVCCPAPALPSLQRGGSSGSCKQGLKSGHFCSIYREQDKHRGVPWAAFLTPARPFPAQPHGLCSPSGGHRVL